MHPSVRIPLALLAALLATVAPMRPAHAECAPVRDVSATRLPASWRAAIDDLVRSTSEPDHPWSCNGGQVALELTKSGATLHVTPEGEAPIARRVVSPEDVLPLGQALLAAAFAPVPPAPPAAEPTPGPGPEPAPAPSPPAPQAPKPVAPAAVPVPAPVPVHEEHPRLLVGAGLDVRGAGGSGVALVGPSVSAAVPLGLWLPSIALRGQSSVGSEGAPIGDFSFALGFGRRIPIGPVEVRGGVALRGAFVLRDLPRPQGQQAEIQARGGLGGALVVPVARWARIVVGLDGDVVLAAARTADATTTTTTSTTTLTEFPTYTLGGNVGVEVPL